MARPLTSSYERLRLQIETPVAQVTLQNPPVNVIDFKMMDELGFIFTEVEALSGVAVVLLRAEGESFSAGVDVAAHTPNKVTAMLEKFHCVIRKMIASTKVTVAAVHGNCLGGGAELAMVCDLVFTADSARWGFPEIQLGCFPPVAVTALSALVGQKRASELILTGMTISGSEAARIGLATRAVEASQLEREVNETIKKLAALSPAALSVTKKAVHVWDSIHFDKGLARAENIYLDELIKTEDAQEGIRAFIEKREPRWKGR